MYRFPLYLLDSGDPNEYREIAQLAKDNGQELWGSTTNPTLIAKKLAGQKVSKEKAFSKLQKQIVLEIVNIVEGAVSAEVYADMDTTSEEMIKQGKEIATWHERVVIKLPTTIEGLKARTQLRKECIPINNTLVFSQQQIFAICLHEKIMQKQYGPITNNKWPAFISPFVGRLDDQNENGMDLVKNGMQIKHLFDDLPNIVPWMLEASVRRLEHMQEGEKLQTELITAPAKVYKEWFPLLNQESGIKNYEYTKNLQPITYWEPPKELLEITSETAFFEAISSGKMNIQHPLTERGIIRFADDWKAIIQ